MKLSQLINELVNFATDLNPGCDDTDILNAEFEVDPEVRIAYQPSYPLAAHLCCTTHLTPDAEPQSEEDEEGWEDHRAEPTSDQPGILWLAAGSSPTTHPTHLVRRGASKDTAVTASGSGGIR